MSLQNVMASFREVGVYPTNRDRVLSKLSIQSTDSQRLQEHPSIPMPFVPFCTPRAQPVQTPQPSLPTPECTPTHTQGRAEIPVMPTNNEASVLHMANPVPSSLPCQFTPAEVQRFQRRLEEGYDLPDERYSQWLSTLPSMYRPSGSILDKILRPPTPPVQRKVGNYARGARVLTSEQCRQELLEKEQEKKKAAEAKEEKRKRAEEAKEQKRQKAKERRQRKKDRRQKRRQRKVY